MLVEGVAARVLAVAVPIPLVAAALVARVLVVARAGALAAAGSLATVSTVVVFVVVVSVAAFISALAAAGLAFALTITLVIAALATILAVVLAILLLLIVARAVPSSGTAAPAAGRAVSGAVVSIHSDNDSRFLAQCGTGFVTNQCAADVSAGALGADGAVSAEESLDIATSSPLHPSQLPQMSLERELVVDNQCRICKMPSQSVLELRSFRIRSADSRSNDISGGERGLGRVWGRF